MTIPIQNIYYLLCYAWNRLEERDVVNVDSLQCVNLVDLLARVLVQGVIRLRKRGFDHGYIEHSEASSTLRGKFNVTETYKRNLLIHAQAHCTFDEFSPNILTNQILRSTLDALIRTREVSKENKERLFECRDLMHGVDVIPLNGHVFRRIQLSRNNGVYGLLLNICELIHRNLLVSESDGEHSFKDFTRDEGQMRNLFEEFVRNFYRRELRGWKVDNKTMHWPAAPIGDSTIQFLPIMKTDITLTNVTQRIIIDTKFTPTIFKQHYLSKKDIFKTGHLYQLFTYLKNSEHELTPVNESIGILLYPTVSFDLDERYQLPGHQIQIRTINLNQAWEQIHYDLLNLVFTCTADKSAELITRNYFRV